MNKDRKSPMTGRPLRNPAQSLDERINSLINEHAMMYFTIGMGMTYLALNEWWRYYRNPPPIPKSVTFIAIIIVTYCAYKFVKIYKELQTLRLGREGEKAVGQFLQGLVENGYRVFHDLLGDNFNIDHVIICKKGIYLIETKTYSKPKKGEAKIYFDGTKIKIHDYAIVDKPIKQVNAASNWLTKMLIGSTGKRFSVKPVILFPGWYVESNEQGKKSNIWVLNPKALATYIKNQPDIMSQEDVMLASYHMCRYIRTKETTR